MESDLQLSFGVSPRVPGQIAMFRDYHVYRVPIQTAGGIIYSYGRGTVGHLQNCLHVPDLNMNLLSTHHVTHYIDDIGIEFQQHICVVRHLFVSFRISSFHTWMVLWMCRICLGLV